MFEFGASMNNFSSETVFTYDGTGKTPTILNFTDEKGNVVNVPSSAYSIHYEQDEVSIGSDVPTEKGWYSLVVTMNSNSGYKLNVDIDNGIKNWITFRIM